VPLPVGGKGAGCRWHVTSTRPACSFRSGRQEDAHEYLVGLLDAMHEGVLAGLHPRPPRETAETSFIYRIFGGRLRSQARRPRAAPRRRRSMGGPHAAATPACHFLHGFVLRATADAQSK
jgi:hypothetical protein